MRTLFLAAAATLLSYSAGTAAPLETLYAQLSDISGNVLVDHGDGFVAVTGATKLIPGDRVMVSGKGRAMLTYGPGCSTPLASDSLTTFTGTESCVIGTQGSPNAGAGLMFMGAAGALGPAGASIGSSISGGDVGNPPPQS